MKIPAKLLACVIVLLTASAGGAPRAEGVDPETSEEITLCLGAAAKEDGESLEACLDRLLADCGGETAEGNDCRYSMSLELLKQSKRMLAGNNSRQAELVDQLDAMAGEVCAFIIGDGYEILMKDYFRSTCLYEKRKNIVRFMMPVRF